MPQVVGHQKSLRQNLKSDRLDFGRSDITYGVKKDQNVESLISLTFDVFFDEVIFDVLIF